MLKRVKALYDYTVRGAEGEVGTVHDVYFDNCTWDVRYIVVDTGPWLLGRKILLSPDVIENLPLGEQRVILTGLTQQQVDESPEIDLEKPVSRQQLEDLHVYYGWPWQGSRFPAPVAYAPPGTMPPAVLPPSLYPPVEERLPNSAKEELKATMQGQRLENPCLRSCREVEGYDIQAPGGEIGHVVDFFVEEGAWTIRYLLVDTRNWLLQGKTVLISTDWITRIDWTDEDVYTDLHRETIKDSPAYDRSKPLPRDYEVILYQHYNRKGYWTDITV